MVRNLLCTIIFIIFQCVTFCVVQSQTLKFKLSAINLPNADLDSPSDPYVQLFRTTWNRGEYHLNWEKFGETAVKPNTLNPSWDEVFEYEYVNGTTQKWGFLVKDLDDSWLNPFDEPLGRVEIHVDDYMFQVRHSQKNEKQPVEYVQLLLSRPIGGALLLKPVVEVEESPPEPVETPAPMSEVNKL